MDAHSKKTKQMIKHVAKGIIAQEKAKKPIPLKRKVKKVRKKLKAKEE